MPRRLVTWSSATAPDGVTLDVMRMVRDGTGRVSVEGAPMLTLIRLLELPGGRWVAQLEDRANREAD